MMMMMTSQNHPADQGIRDGNGQIPLDFWAMQTRSWVVSCFEMCFRWVLWNQMSIVYHIVLYFLRHSLIHFSYVPTSRWSMHWTPNFVFFWAQLRGFSVREPTVGGWLWVATAHVSRIWSAMVKVVNACLGQVICWYGQPILSPGFFKGGNFIGVSMDPSMFLGMQKPWAPKEVQIFKEAEELGQSVILQNGWQLAQSDKLAVKTKCTNYDRKVRQRECSNNADLSSFKNTFDVHPFLFQEYPTINRMRSWIWNRLQDIARQVFALWESKITMEHTSFWCICYPREI